MMKEPCIHLGYFEPADGRHVPNPGMGQMGYIFSDHMHTALSRRTWVWTETHDNNRAMDRTSFDRFLALPYVDLLYVRNEWCDIHKGPGKLEIPEAFRWMLEAVEKHGKRWVFRVMNSSPHSRFETSVPEFLIDRFEYETYWHNHSQVPPWPKKYPRYTEEYFKWWGELVHLVADRWDSHPLLEFTEIAGFGHWAEAHHYGSYTGPEGPIYNKDPDGVEEIVDRIIQIHLDAFTRTPSVLNMHFTEYEAGMKHLKAGKVWLRRDSFQEGFSIHEWRNATSLQPGQAMLWEPYPNPWEKGRETAPPSAPGAIVDRMLDSGACYTTLGFNSWDAINLHHLRVDDIARVAAKIGYRLRPTIIWRRYPVGDNGQKIAVALVNDGCAGPPGTITLTAHFPSGAAVECELPLGEPAAGSRPVAEFDVPRADEQSTCDDELAITAEIRLLSKRYPVRWAVKQFLADPHRIVVPLYEVTDIGREVPLPGSNAPGTGDDPIRIRYDRPGNLLPPGVVVGIQGSTMASPDDLASKERS